MSESTFSLKVFDLNGKEVDKVDVSAEVLGGIVRKRLINEVAVLQQRNQRQGSANTKSRGEIQSSSKKPWRQKGTGRARAGDRNSNIWRGGSVAHGPRPRDFSVAIPKKIRRQALASVLLGKIKDEEITLVNSLNFEVPKTKEALKVLKNLKIDKKVLVANHEYDPASLLSFRNIPTVQTIPSQDLNILSILKNKHLLMTKEGFEQITERFQAGLKETVAV